MREAGSQTTDPLPQGADSPAGETREHAGSLQCDMCCERCEQGLMFRYRRGEEVEKGFLKKAAFKIA